MCPYVTHISSLLTHTKTRLSNTNECQYVIHIRSLLKHTKTRHFNCIGMSCFRSLSDQMRPNICQKRHHKCDILTPITSSKPSELKFWKAFCVEKGKKEWNALIWCVSGET